MAGLFRRGSGAPPPPFEDLEFKRPVFKFEGQRGIDRRKAEARDKGKKDGRAGVPGPHHTDSLAANAYNDEAERLLGQISRDWHETSRILRGEWCRLRHLLPQREKLVPPAEKAVRKAEERVEEKRAELERQRAVARSAAPGTRHRIGKAAYVFGLIAVFLVDVPLNAVVFQIFGENALATWALAAVIGIVMVPAAHELGTQIRNGFPDKIISAIAFAGPFLFILAVAALRTKWLQDNNVALKGGLGFVVFLAFNLAVFVAAIVLSYLRHDPHQQHIEEAKAELKEAAAELAVAQAELTRLSRDVEAIRGRIAELHAWGEDELRKAKDWVSAERNFFEELIDEYLGANQRARERPGDVIPAIENARRKKPSIPPDLAENAPLHWTCDDASAPLGTEA